MTLERDFGSVIRGMQNAPKKAQTSIEPGSPVPNTMFLSLKNGMYSLIEGLQARLTGNVRTGQTLTHIDADGTLHIQTTDSKEELLRGEKVILTIPSIAVGKLLSTAAPELANLMKQGRVVSSGTISLGYRADEISHPLDGFGFVVPTHEATHLLACTWSSTKLPYRVPEGHVLLRVFVGGHAHESDVELSDIELIVLARSELKRLMGITAEPIISRVFRWRNANPQYEVGHINRVAQMETLCPLWLHLAGCSYEGVGIPDCVRQGREAARTIAASS